MGAKFRYVVNVVIVVLLLATVAIQRDGRIVGYDVATLVQGQNGDDVDIPIVTTMPDGTMVINTTSLAKDVVGFGGRTPVKVYVKDDVIASVEVLPNNETPSFLEEVVKSGLIDRWGGMSLTDAATYGVDAVSGATYSSVAIVENVKRAAQWGAEVEVDGDGLFEDIAVKDIVGLLVILMGVVITLAKVKSRRLMTLQLILNVVVLGFWCGSFLSLSTLTTWLGNGVNLSLGLVSVALLGVVLIVPLLGKKGSYCQLHCPMGSAQELLGRVPVLNIKIKPRIVKVLNNLRYYILVALLFVMWLGVGFDLMNYEIFSAFIFTSASTAVLIMAAIFLILSLFIHRPYCRFVCPTGALITMTQKVK